MGRASVPNRARVNVSTVSFYEWVKEVAGESDEKIGGRIGVTGKTVGGWKHRDPNPRDLFEFAKQYERSIPDALINAYGLTSADLRQRDLTPAGLSNAALVAELVRRLGLRVDDMYEALETRDAVLTSDRLTRGQRPQP
jgi:hypothetical protein